MYQNTSSERLIPAANVWCQRLFQTGLTAPKIQSKSLSYLDGYLEKVGGGWGWWGCNHNRNHMFSNRRWQLGRVMRIHGLSSRDRVPSRVQTSFLSASVILGAVESFSGCWRNPNTSLVVAKVTCRGDADRLRPSRRSLCTSFYFSASRGLKHKLGMIQHTQERCGIEADFRKMVPQLGCFTTSGTASTLWWFYSKVLL